MKKKMKKNEKKMNRLLVKYNFNLGSKHPWKNVKQGHDTMACHCVLSITIYLFVIH